MITDPLTGARKPEQTDGPLGGLQIANVIDDLVPNTVPSFANATARNTAYSNWVAAGGVMRKGLKSHTQNDDRYWRYDGSAWQYAGGAPPPIVLSTMASGWTAAASQKPGAFKDASGLIHLVGEALNGVAYDPNDGFTTRTVLTLPTGYWPASPVQFMMHTSSAGTGRIVMGEISTLGVLRITGGTTGIGTNFGHFLSAIPPFHPGYVDGALS